MQIFISYSSKNRPAVTALAADLERLGHDVWFDHELTGGHVWWNDILSNIRACDLFIVALTPQLLDSVPCQLEARYAAALNKRVLPVLTANVETALVPSIFSALQFVDYRQRNRDSVLALGRALGHLPAPQPLPKPLPTPPAVPLSPLANLRERIESPEPLRREEQATILMEIRELLNHRATAANARVLLQRLRQRNDLLANVASEIDRLLQGGGRGRRTLLIGGVIAVVALFILGSEMLSLFTLSRKTPTPLAQKGTVTSTATEPDSPTTESQPSDTPDFITMATAIISRLPSTATPAAEEPKSFPRATMTGDAYVSGSVTLDCQGFVGNALTFNMIIANTSTPDIEIMRARVTDGAGKVIYEKLYTATATSPVHINGRFAYSTAPAYDPLVFTLSSTLEQSGDEKTYYLGSGSCPDVPRLDVTPVPASSLDDINYDYLAIGYLNIPEQPVKSSGGLSSKIRYKLTSVTEEQLQSGDVRLYLLVKRFADPDCTVPIPVTAGLGIAGSIQDQGLGTASNDGLEYDVAYTAFDTPYIALQGYIWRRSDDAILARDYSTTAGCFKVAPGS